MERLQYESAMPQILNKIRTGALLCVQAGDNANVMTIGWASFGFMWGRPIMTIAIRPTRYTFELIEKARDFTVTVPEGDLTKELECCGTETGRKCDKFKKCNLEMFPSVKVRTPILMIPGIHFECVIACKSTIDPDSIIDEYIRLYPQKDYHVLYHGEIKDCYSTVDERTK
jgi:flavin reductase (DIM6/NTAB) family NADH-FMN oxidoreductase RutF